MFEFDRYIGGERIRARKYLPKTWTQAEADAFDRAESARLYAVATNVTKSDYLIEDAVNIYVKERVPHLKSGLNVTREFALMYWAYKGRSINALSEACKFYATNVGRENESINKPLAPASIRNRIRLLTAACRYGWKHHGMCESDTAAKVNAPTFKNERQEYVNRRQMLALSAACTNRAGRLAIRIAFYSGLRVGEILRTEIRGRLFT